MLSSADEDLNSIGHSEFDAKLVELPFENHLGHKRTNGTHL